MAQRVFRRILWTAIVVAIPAGVVVAIFATSSGEWSATATVSLASLGLGALGAVLALLTESADNSNSSSRNDVESEVFSVSAAALDNIALLEGWSDRVPKEPGVFTVPPEEVQRLVVSTRELTLRLVGLGAGDEAREISAQLRSALLRHGHVDWLFWISATDQSSAEGNDRG